MRFELPNAVAAMNNAVAAVGADGDSWEIIGDPLTELVDDRIPAYDEKLDLKLDPSAGAKRAEISTVRWGKIDKDIARLNGLVAAVRDVTSVIRSGRDTIAHEWKGESFEAFRTQIEKVEKTLDDYASAVETTASGLQAAIDGTRQLFTSYRDDSLAMGLEKFSPPGDWWRMSADDAEFFVANCTSQTAISDCLYNNDEQLAIIDRKLTNRRYRDQVEKWDCTRNPGVVIGQYNYLVKSAYDERALIQDKIGNWYDATETLKTNVSDALDAALENLRIIAEVKVFSTLAVPGASAPAGGPGPGTGGGDPGPGAGYPGPGGGGDVAMPSPEPAPAAVEPIAVEPVAVDPVTVDPVAVEPEPARPEETGPAAGAETVSIEDGDRTISVSSPDGHGHVKVTVDDGTGTTKSYSLDFDAASGLLPRPGAEAPPEAEDGVTQVPARSDGKCVIQDGAVTITAERPLFSPDSLSVTVADGTGPPRTYTLDFPEEPATAEDPATGQPDPAVARGPAATASEAATEQPTSRPTGVGQEPEAAGQGTPRPAAGQEPQEAAGQGTSRPAAGQEPPVAGQPDGQGTSRPAAGQEPQPATAQAEAGQGTPLAAAAAVQPDAAQAAVHAGAGQETVHSAAAGAQSGAAQVVGHAGAGQELAHSAGAGSDVSQPGAGPAVHAGTGQGTSQQGLAGQPEVPQQGLAAGGTTHAQAWTSDQAGSLSGVLESNQDEPSQGEPSRRSGEAGLAAVPDAPKPDASDATGMAGSGLPMTGGGANGAGGEPGRIGSGWSVHGDLFDSGEPVYSMHGVLGDDDAESREVR